VRRAIAERLSRAKREVPHAYGVVEADVTDLVRWYEAHREGFQRQHGVRLTYTALFARAAVEALRAFPVVNAQWAEDAIVLKPHINLGVAVSVEEGLVVPVLHRAEEKSLVGIARELEDLTRRAREGRLTLEDVQGGTFTLTNPGVFGSIWSLPIVNYPQAAILATDAIVKRPVVRDDAIAIRAVMHLGLSFDHRVFDGAVAVQFLNHVKASLEAVDPVIR
jgi:2-oxoisovalerate dehydrogenase E2 component (dihydrolipoyl transacylase)